MGDRRRAEPQHARCGQRPNGLATPRVGGHDRPEQQSPPVQLSHLVGDQPGPDVHRAIKGLGDPRADAARSELERRRLGEHRCHQRADAQIDLVRRPGRHRCHRCRRGRVRSGRRAGCRGDDRAGDLGRSQIGPVVIDLDDDSASGAGKDIGPPDRRRERQRRTAAHAGHDGDVGRVRLDQGRDRRQAHGKGRDPAVVDRPRKRVPGEHGSGRERRVVDPREALDRPTECDVGWTVVGEAGEPDRITGTEPGRVRPVGVPDRRRHDASGPCGA